MATKKLQQTILEELELTDLPEETQIKLLTQMTESVLKRITIRVLERLPEQDRIDLEKLQADGDLEKVNEFLKDKIPNYEQMIQEIVSEFKEEMKTNIETLKQG